MDSYTENEIEKGQTMPDLFVMVPPCLLLVYDARNETKEETVTRIGQTLPALFESAEIIQQAVPVELDCKILQTLSEEFVSR